jgi:hypothetical protein
MDCDLLREQIEGSYRAPVVGLLPLHSDMAGLASSALFSIRFPDHPLTQELKGIARRIMS